MKKKTDIDIGAALAKIHPLMMRELTKRQANIFSKGLLTIPQMVVLELLQERGQCNMSELADALNVTMSAVTAIVNKMINLKLVKREHSTQDRRIVNVIILQKGTDIIRRINREKQDMVEDVLSCLTQEDKKGYLRLLEKIYENLKKKQ